MVWEGVSCAASMRASSDQCLRANMRARTVSTLTDNRGL
jgi:hypothetical protein